MKTMIDQAVKSIADQLPDAPKQDEQLLQLSQLRRFQLKALSIAEAVENHARLAKQAAFSTLDEIEQRIELRKAELGICEGCMNFALKDSPLCAECEQGEAEHRLEGER